MQELQTFLEADGSLSNSLDWQSLQPLQGSFLDGATRLPKQLLGMPSTPLSSFLNASDPQIFTLHKIQKPAFCMSQAGLSTCDFVASTLFFWIWCF